MLGGKAAARPSSAEPLDARAPGLDLEPEYDGLTCLVTGGAGFVGSHLVEALLARGARVRVLDDLSAGRPENLEAVRHDARLRVVVGSAADPRAVLEAVRGASVVFHLAAVVGVRRVWEAPAHAYEANARSSALVLAAAARAGARVLFASSSEVYGRGGPAPLAEDAPLLAGADDPRRWAYARSKALGEALAERHARRDGLSAVCVRLFNVVGPRQRPEGGMVLPRLVRQARAGEPLCVFGDGRQTRSFLDARDAARALCALGRPGGPTGPCNLGAERETSILALAELVRDALAPGLSIVRVPYEEAYGPGFVEPRRRRPDLTRLRALTGIRPAVPLERTVLELARECPARPLSGAVPG